jgi:hypothetical protein
MSPETVVQLVGDLATEFGLSPEDVEAILAQGLRIREVVAQLDELPLADVEPAGVYKVV